MSRGALLAEAAQGVVGSRFRLHGRDPATGLDCIGVLAAALAATGQKATFPTGYSIRTGRFDDLAALAEAHGFAPATGIVLAGDVLFVRPGPAQMHLLIAAVDPGHFVEAHAGLGRVILRPGPLIDQVLQRWRLQAPLREV